MVLENVDKAQTKIRLRKDNVAGKAIIVALHVNNNDNGSVNVNH